VGELFSGPPDYKTIAPIAVIAPSEDSGAPMPPYAAVQIEDGEKMFHQEETSYLRGALRWVTRADSTNVEEHSQNFKRIYNAFSDLGSGYDFMRRITVHGIDVTSTTDYYDEARQAHGDVILFTMGASERS
jgi:hypothetical protein